MLVIYCGAILYMDVLISREHMDVRSDCSNHGKAKSDGPILQKNIAGCYM